MKYLKATIRYGIYFVLLPLILAALLSLVVVTLLDWYVEIMQSLVTKVGEVLA